MHLGIDLGTCYSSAALILGGIPTPIKEPLKQIYSFPSSIFVTKQGEIVIGQAAENQRRLDPNRYRQEFKRDLGNDVPYSLGEQQMRPEELISEFIRGLKAEAERMVNHPLPQAIITVPATYLSHKRQLMEKAAQQAGFEDILLLEEPVAAAIYYAQKGSGGQGLADGEIVLVYDLGGGTFDAALIKKHGTSYKILTQPIGDEQCGGIDFDLQIYEHLKSTLGNTLGDLLDPQRRDIAALRARLIIGEWCRNFKHQLSVVSEYEDLLPIGELSAAVYRLSREEFQHMIAPFIDRSCVLCQKLIEQAGLTNSQVNHILLVGGCCRIPYVQQRLQKAFSSPVIRVDEPELAICFGAALYGAWLETDGAVAFVQQGREHIEAGNYAEAMVAFNQAIHLNPHYAEAYFCRGATRYHQGAQAALEDYEQALKLNPNFQLVITSRDHAQTQLELCQRQTVSDWVSLQQKQFQFEVVTVDSQGNIQDQQTKQAEYYTEELGMGVLLEMVKIPGGTFAMGSPPNQGFENERPQHRVTVASFAMGIYPVTQAQWRVIALMPEVNRALNTDPSRFKCANCPVENVSWYDAIEFCARLSQKLGREYRLPSEAEWEYACRGGTDTPFHFGETITPDLVNYDGNFAYGQGSKGENRRQTTEVGSFNVANAYGLYDMHGNVWEWCQDHWHDSYTEKLPTDGSAWLTNNENETHVLRGGSWFSTPALCRSAYRRKDSSDLSSSGTGFRIVYSAPRAA